METWATFWAIVLIAVLIVFSVVAIKVTIGGFFDVKALFRSIDEQHEEKENE